MNVLVALLWPTHEDHLRVQHWFGRNSRTGSATCPFTQAAFVRISANPAFSADAVKPLEAIKYSAAICSIHLTDFGRMKSAFTEATQPFHERVAGHRQVTDAYLLRLAIHMKGKLATMDRAVLGLLSDKRHERGSVELI